MGRVEGKVAFISGLARGQGRSHAIRLAEEGADIIGVDICEDIEFNNYPLARPEDLAITVKEVEARGRRIFTEQVDVRDRLATKAAIDEGVAELGRLDVVVANAGICPMGPEPIQTFFDTAQVCLTGVLNVLDASMPHLKSGASIIATGSVLALRVGGTNSEVTGPGGRRLRLGQARRRQLDPRPGERAGAAGHPRECRAPDQREQRHAAQPGRLQGLPPGPGQPDGRRRDGRLRPQPADACALDRGRGHHQRGALACIR